METFKGFYSTVLILHVALMIITLMVHAQDDQSDFISIDSGIPEGSKYTDKRTGITYVSDAGFIEGGVSSEIPPAYNFENLDLQLTTLRSFPKNTRNCYTLKPKQGKNNRYLIRMTFYYANYDSKDEPPQFDVYLGADIWSQGSIPDPYVDYYIELVHLAPSDYIHICLVNTGQGIPFCSAIELRLLDINMYEPRSTSLDVFHRTSYGSNEQVRYADDKYDRVWYPFTIPDSKAVQTSNIVSSGPLQVPSKVMSTANTPTISTDNIILMWNTTTTYIFYVHFAEVEILKSNQTREFNVYLNGDHMYGPFSPSTNTTTVICTSLLMGFSSYTLEIKKTLKSTLPPLINAIEIYIPKKFQLQQTEDQDVAAILKMKSTYGLKRNWQGDPCVPHAFLWDGLDCNYNDPGAARIIFLNLSSSRLSGEIATALANLTMIESLDLSYNNLTGNVPEILARLDKLKILNLTGNNFTGPLPVELLEKSKKGSLWLSIEESSGEDKRSCLEGSCRNNKHKISRVIIAAITIVLALMVLSSFAIVWIVKRLRNKALIKTNGSLTLRKQQFTYSEVVVITNNFQNEIGRGGFGSVFHGFVEDNQVAVKMLSESSSQGYKEFEAEVKLLMEIHHTNITSLVGYCDDTNHKGIIYDFMANGSLGKHLFDGSPNVLSWERRIQIGCDVAEGLAYLHHGCRPPIVHRDVKSANILLNEGFQAKLADFGLSRAYPIEDGTNVSSLKVAGTIGYLDPEYHSTNKLTEKTDVYSFGVVLLELITGRRAIANATNIVQWVKSPFKEGNVESIIDSRLEGRFDINIAWEVIEIAMSCVSHLSVERPTMNDVVVDLKHCLQAVKTHQTEHVSLNLQSMSDIHPR